MSWYRRGYKSNFHGMFCRGVIHLDAIALTGWHRLDVFSLELLELSTLNTRRFLFLPPESLSRWLDQASLGFACSAAKRRARFYKLRTEFTCSIREFRLTRAGSKTEPRG